MILAVVPARAGSQRLPRKNLMEIEPGLSLVQHAIDCARYSGLVDHVCVSSDDPDMIHHGAAHILRPDNISGPRADISQAVKHATEAMEERTGKTFSYVLTLQPAVLARSPLIVRRIIERTACGPYHGAITAAFTVPWQWSVDISGAHNGWYPRPYPRSQESSHHFAEINAVQLASREMVANGERWGQPLALVGLPPWACALDIDTPQDLAAARDLWPWARTRLETWEPPIFPCGSINGRAP